jgi:5-methylcytosine-specific restriction endonuclease McrA
MDITRLLARDGNKCQLCGGTLDRHIKDPDDPHYITFDHIVVPGEGGGDELANKQLAHSHCNQKRSNQPILPVEAFRSQVLGLAHGSEGAQP